MTIPRHWTWLVCALILGAWLAGCSRESFSSYKDFDAIVTVYDPEYLDQFENNRTFAMPEEVFDLSDAVNDPIERDGDYDQRILDQVAENMAELGYDREVITGDPSEMNTDADVIVYVGAVAQEDWGYASYYWYGWYWYYPTTVKINYDNGTIVFTMVDPDLVDPVEEVVPVVWTGGVRGLLGYHSVSDVEAGVDKAFEQSEYLRVGPPVDSKPGLGAPDAGSN